LGGNQYVLARFADSLAPVFVPGDIRAAFAVRPVPGDTITLYGIGFGLVTPDSPVGQIVQQDNMLVNAGIWKQCTEFSTLIHFTTSRAAAMFICASSGSPPGC
jgi:hypothetical protein